MSKVLGHEFYDSQEKCFHAHPNGKMFIRLCFTSFMGFDSMTEYFSWLKKYKRICDSKKMSIQIYEEVKVDLTNAFYADIEAYCERILTDEEIGYIQEKIMTKFESSIKETFPRITRASAWTADHRPDTKKDGYKFKLSMHVIVNELLFNDISREGPMHGLATDINYMMMTQFDSENDPLINSLYIPKKELLDMAVYRSNGCMRAPFASKSSNPNEYFKPIGEFTKIEDYFITKDIPYNDIPPELLVKYESKNKTSVTKKTIPTKFKEVNNEDQTDMERIISNHMKTWGDTTSTVKAAGFDYNGCLKFYARGPKRSCPCPSCGGIVHDGNGGKIINMGSGNFTYKCLSPTNTDNSIVKFYIPSGNDRTRVSKKRRKKEKTLSDIKVNSDIGSGIKVKSYLRSLVGITKRCIVVKAPMGSGKTYATMKFIESLDGNPSVLWVTPRKTMAMKIKGDYPKFALYTEEINEMYQVVEYESLNKITVTYDVIILDEIRSLIKSFTSIVTNKDNLIEHMDFLVDLCRNSRHTLMLDADIKIDGAVKAFTDHTFPHEEIEEIDHKEGSMELKIVHLNKGSILKSMYADLRSGKRIMACFGSSHKLRTIAEEVSKIIDPSKVGIFHANSDIQAELLNVNTNWDKYDFIGFTSTITVSVSYEGDIDRVYVFPEFTSATPREMVQMVARARKIRTREVYVELNRDDIFAHSPDMKALYEEKLADFIKKRKYMIECQNDTEKMYVSTIKKTVTRNGIVYTPHILTKLGAWDMVEEYLKRYFWHNEFLRIIEAKGFTWRLDEYIDLEEDREKSSHLELLSDCKETRRRIKQDDILKLTNTEARFLEPGVIASIIMMKTVNTATEEEKLIYRKYEAQKYFEDKLTGEQVMDFEKNKRGIINLILLYKMNSIFFTKLHINEEEMGLEVPEFRKGDIYVIKLLKMCLTKYGISSFFDTETEIDLEINEIGVKKTLDKIDNVTMKRSTSKKTNVRLSYYLQTYVGVSINCSQLWRGDLNKKINCFKLAVKHKDWLQEKSILGTEQWTRRKFEQYDSFKKDILGSEYKKNTSRRIVVDCCNRYKKKFRRHFPFSDDVMVSMF